MGGLFQMQKCGFCFQPSSGYDCWASSNAEVWFSVSSCLLGTILEHLQMQKAWFLFPAIFFVWSLSLFKCGSMVFVSSYLLGMVVELLQMRKYGFCFLPSFGYDSWVPQSQTMIFASNYGFGMIIELQIWMYRFFFPPATLWVRFCSSRFACGSFVVPSKAIWTEKQAKVGQVLGYVESPSTRFNTCRKTEKSDAREIMTCTSNCFDIDNLSDAIEIMTCTCKCLIFTFCLMQ